MKFHFAADNVKFEIVDNDGKGVLLFTTKEYSIEADAPGLIRAFAELQVAAQDIVAKIAAEEDQSFQAMMASFETKPKDEA